MDPGRNPTHRPDAGFTLVEIMLLVAIASILMAMSVAGLTGTAKIVRGRSAMAQVTAQLRLARDLAVSQRRSIEVRFVGSNEILIIRQDVPNGTTQLNRYFLEGNVQYTKFPGVPDTPDGFGNAQAVDFGGETPIFNPEGRLTDDGGATLSGTVFLGIPGEPSSQHAVTVFGGTARVRGYAWNGTQWVD